MTDAKGGIAQMVLAVETLGAGDVALDGDLIVKSVIAVTAAKVLAAFIVEWCGITCL